MQFKGQVIHELLFCSVLLVFFDTLLSIIYQAKPGISSFLRTKECIELPHVMLVNFDYSGTVRY